MHKRLMIVTGLLALGMAGAQSTKPEATNPNRFGLVPVAWILTRLPE
jgi:hypothetical protein